MYNKESLQIMEKKTGGKNEKNASGSVCIDSVFITALNREKF
jgi:hypothetical protein